MSKLSFFTFVFALAIVFPALAQGDVRDGCTWEQPFFDYQKFYFLKDGNVYTAIVYDSKDIKVEPKCFRPLFRNYYIKIWSPDHYAIAKFKRCPTSEDFKRYSEILQADNEVYSRKEFCQDGNSQNKLCHLRLGHGYLTSIRNNTVSHVDSSLLTLDTRKLHHADHDIYLFAGVSENVKYDTPPTFPGGMDSLVSFVTSRLDYTILNTVDVVGTVLVEFVVEANGNVTSPEIKVSLYPDCDENALLIIREMPYWKPATYKGKAIRCRYQIPITFC